MEEPELVKKMLSGMKKPNVADDLLKDLNLTRMASLQEAADEIRAQIMQREQLHTQMLSDVEDLKSSINNMMPQMPNPTVEFQKAMVEMKKKLIEADEMKVQEKLNCFRDVALLKKELREFSRELRDKEQRADLLGNLISQ